MLHSESKACSSTITSLAGTSKHLNPYSASDIYTPSSYLQLQSRTGWNAFSRDLLVRNAPSEDIDQGMTPTVSIPLTFSIVMCWRISVSILVGSTYTSHQSRCIRVLPRPYGKRFS